jgi:hypothetical protein
MRMADVLGFESFLEKHEPFEPFALQDAFLT